MSDYLTPRDVADRWRCSVRTVERKIALGELRAVRFGPKLIRVRPDDLDAIESILALVSRLEETIRADGECVDILVSNILDASFDGETDDIRPIEPEDQAHIISCARRIARARLSARQEGAGK